MLEYEEIVQFEVLTFIHLMLEMQVLEIEDEDYLYFDKRTTYTKLEINQIFYN